MANEIQELFDRLQAEKAEIVAAAAPIREKRDAVAAKAHALEAEMRELAQQLFAIERPRLAELDNQISGLAIALGAKRLSDPIAVVVEEAPAEDPPAAE